MIEKTLKRTVFGAALTVLAVCVCFAVSGCGKKEQADAGNASETLSGALSDASGASGDLEPVSVFFPESYTTFVPEHGDGENISAAKCVGIKVRDGVTAMYDPISLEGTSFDFGFTTLSGAGCGGGVSEFEAVYGMNDKNSFTTDGKIMAVLLLDGEGNVTYLDPARVYQTVETLAEGGRDYADYAKLGNNILTVTIYASGGTVEGFEVIHYIF